MGIDYRKADLYYFSSPEMAYERGDATGREIFFKQWETVHIIGYWPEAEAKKIYEWLKEHIKFEHWLEISFAEPELFEDEFDSIGGDIVEFALLHNEKEEELDKFMWHLKLIFT